MQVKFKERFFDELDEIRKFICKDSLTRADAFVDDVMAKCLNLKDMPSAHRPSRVLRRSGARDLIFKGYVIPYLINNDEILILGIYKANDWKE